MKVCVFGAGNMGARITEVFLNAGHDVTMIDIKPEFTERGKTVITHDYEFLVSKGKMTAERKDELLASPGCGGTQRLARLVGAGKAKEMLYTARANYTAQDALNMGLVNYVYPLENLLDEAVKLAEEIAAQAPIAVSLVKEAVNVGMQTDLNSALKFEGNCFAQCFATEDQKYGMAYFLDKNRDKPAKEFKNK